MIAVQPNPPSTLIDVISQVRELLDAIGDATPVLVGKAHEKHGVGSSPRVLFLPESGSGKVGPPIEIGNAASVTHTCTVKARAKESGDDETRLLAAYALSDFLIDAISTAGSGRITWGSYGDGSPTDTDAFGAEIVFEFSYRRDVMHSAKRWPVGKPAGGIEVEAETVPKFTGDATT